MNTPASSNTPALPMPATKHAHGRSLADFVPLLKAEKDLLDCCATGEEARIGNGVPADGSDPNTVVRASFLRFLLLGGDEQAPVHEHGVQLHGAWIQGQLDLKNCRVPHGMTLSNCKFVMPIIARDAHIAGLFNLSGSHLLQGLSAERLRCDSSVFLRDGFQSFAEIQMYGAQIGGNLECSVGLFDPKEGHSLMADRAVVRGDVFLAQQFKATGQVRFFCAQIGGNLDCSFGQFEPKEGHALFADHAVVNGTVFLNKQFKATGQVRLFGTQIGGNLECSGGQFVAQVGNSLTAEGVVVVGSVLLDKQFKATRTVWLARAQIGGHLHCSAGQFEPTEGYALVVDGAIVKGNVVLAEQFKATGTVRLFGAQIGSTLDCSDGQFEPKEGYAIVADGTVVKGSVFLNKQFKATGQVRLFGAQIGGNLHCSAGHFEPKGGDALCADNAVVKGNVFLNKQFKATGTVRFLGAQIASTMDCSDGQFEPKGGDAFYADNAVVKGDVFLSGQFKATGEIRLLGAQIGGNLDCSEGQFEPKAGDALSADSAVIKGNVYLKNKFKATGTVRLASVQIGGDLSCIGGQFSEHTADALLLQTATIQSCLILRGLATTVRIDATSAQIGMLVDEPTVWAKGSILNGLVYRSFAGTAPTSAAHRIAWLKQQSAKDLGEDGPKQGFRPQPWKQLQKVLREMGHEADARQVGIAFEDQLRKADRIGQITDVSKAKEIIPVVRRQCLRGLHWLFGALAGYGYRPMRLLTSMVAVWLFCSLAYWWLALPPSNALGPTDPLVFQHSEYAACTAVNKGNWFLCGPLPAEYTTFSPLAYSLDILLPLVDLGQEKSWGPLVPTPQQPFYVELLSLSPAHLVRWLNWFEILYGWVASLLFVAIVSGMSRRSEMEK